MQHSNTGIVISILIAGGIIAAAIVFSIGGPTQEGRSDPFVEVKNAVANQMVDPASATFRGVYAKIEGFSYCGEVNVKNRLGGYVGYERFFAQKEMSGSWIVTLDKRIVEGMCK